MCIPVVIGEGAEYVVVAQAATQLFHQDFDPSPTSPSWLRNTTIVSWMLHLFSIESHGQRLSNGLYLHRPNKP